MNRPAIEVYQPSGGAHRDLRQRQIRREEHKLDLVTIVGEPGVGKSRLLHEFRTVFDTRSDLVWWRQGRCLPCGEGITYWALGEIIKAQAGILETDAEEDAERKLRHAVNSLIDDPARAEWIRARLVPLAGGPAGGD